MSETYSLQNYTEILVDDGINKLWGKSANVCKCNRCYLDTMALALNQLPPKYVVTNNGEVYAKIDSLINQKQVDVMSAVTKASVMVNENYSHSPEEAVFE